MKRNNAQNSSAKKNLIPAVAMFTASAVMLSTATYAWFTMNKEVEVTGLKMTATAGKSLEISLGEIDGAAHTNNAPAYNSESWKSQILVADYYDQIGKLKPASSNTGDEIFTIKTGSDIYGGGMKVKSDATVSKVASSDTAQMNLRTTAAGEDASVESTDNSGYFIDVPMWIRCSASEETAVKCAVTISDPDATNGSDLTKAVRVAVLPISEATSKMDGTADGIKDLTLTGSAAMYADKATSSDIVKGTGSKIYGLNDSTYNTGAISKTTGATYVDNLAAITGFVTANDGADDTTKNDINKDSDTTVFTLNTAENKNVFSGESFIVRVWLEGESVYCNDATSDQDWNINFHFYVDEGND